MVDVLAALHAVDPHEVELTPLGRPAGFLARQVRRWGQQLQRSAGWDLPDADVLLARLAERVPADDRTGTSTGIVHGDFKLDNVLALPGQPRPVQAVIDWEMATVGDTWTDVALLLVYVRLGTLAGAAAVTDVSSAPGFPSGGQLLDRYAASSGRDPGAAGGLRFHLGLAHLKLAVILEGIHFRFPRRPNGGRRFRRRRTSRRTAARSGPHGAATPAQPLIDSARPNPENEER